MFGGLGTRACALSLALIASASVAGQANGNNGFLHLKFSGHVVRWMGADTGGDVTVTYRIATDDAISEGAVNCRHMVPANAVARAANISPEAFRHELASAFALWSKVARINFVEAAADAAADIVVGAQGEPSGRAFAQVFYDRDHPNTVKPITRSLVCLNPNMPWKVGFDGDLAVYDLRYTLAHEIGHAIGLDHPDNSGHLMFFRYDETVRALSAGDIAGATSLYGVRRSREEQSVERTHAGSQSRP